MASTPFSRRRLLKAGVAASALTAAPFIASPLLNASASTTPSPARKRPSGAALPEFQELEQRYNARLGVYGHNTETGQVVAHRAGEQFAMCSTFKPIAAAAILRDQSKCAPLDKVIYYPPHEIVTYSPITEKHVEDGMTVGDIAAAAIQYSDNSAGNLLLRQIGGPKGLTAFCRSIGDQVTRLDRWETQLNSAIPGDPRDTTTPEALGRTYGRLALGSALSDDDRKQLVSWLKGNTTSGARFRAGLPENWVIGDKTGTGDYATAHDIGVAWTTKGTPLVLAVMSSKDTVDAPVDNALIADAARVLARMLAPGE